MTAISFFGAAGTVTGSCLMIETGGRKFIVDCGMFQGNKSVRRLNYEPFPFEPGVADFLLLTHAHIDHSGLLPKLVKHGFGGPIYCTAPTVDLLGFMLMDSARIQESHTERENRKRQRRGEDLVVPLYEERHVRETLERLKSVEYGSWFEPASGISARYWNAGHILGSASVEVKFDEPETGNTMRLLFSGDIGPDEKVFYAEPEAEKGFDYIVCESTYGDRERDDYTLATRRDALRKELTEGLERGGNVVIPCFAVERSQELLHDIGYLLAKGEIPDCYVFLDSPLATRVTEVFIKYAGTLEDIEVKEADLFRNEKFRLVEDVEESMAINRIDGGAIIISASGMADAGRIQHHLKHNIWNRKSTVLFVGYQAPGTLGNIILGGAEDVRIHGKEFKVRARIRQLGNYSAHADQSELVDWIHERGRPAGGLFLNHGDDDARAVLRDLLGARGMDVSKIHLPQFDETFDIAADTPQSKGREEPRIDDDQLLRDWYNDYAAFVIDLGNALESEGDADRRKALIARLQAELRTVAQR
jgi:metallo-beta-lactamase family protein